MQGLKAWATSNNDGEYLGEPEALEWAIKHSKCKALNGPDS